MHFPTTSFLAIVALCISTTFSIPFAEPNDSRYPLLESSEFDTRNAKPEPEPRSPNPPTPPTPPTPPGGSGCQKPISQNLCTSGSPYCCTGSGSSQVCGPAGSVTCASTTICCINTNGMQICAGEIDFTGPVTININNYNL